MNTDELKEPPQWWLFFCVQINKFIPLSISGILLLGILV
nr:MAG TPA: hypothetical protein [Caudoviricetes sp.]DAH47733.1 MAG TPA: hypothetical protein [Caudoviricetes sp.]